MAMERAKCESVVSREFSMNIVQAPLQFMQFSRTLGKPPLVHQITDELPAFTSREYGDQRQPNDAAGGKRKLTKTQSSNTVPVQFGVD